MNLPAGRLRHRITLYALTSTQDEATGDQTESYNPVALDVPAEFTPVSAGEFVAAQAVQSKVVARVRIRYRDGVVPTMRLSFRGAMFNIEGVLPDNESGYEYLTLPCSQVTTP